MVESQEATPEHDLTTPEGIKNRAQELREAKKQTQLAFTECIDHLQEHRQLHRSDVDAIMTRHNVPGSLIEYVEGVNENVLPVVSMSGYERESTALGKNADEWLDRELSEEKQACDEAASAYRDAHNVYTATRRSEGFDRLKEVHDARDGALQGYRTARDGYYARKRELMGQLRETGQELEWTTAGASTPARVNETIQASATFLPSDWIASSNRLSAPDEVARNPDKLHPVNPVYVSESTTRNHYSPHEEVRTGTNGTETLAELTIPRGRGKQGGPSATATHELIHRCEDVNSTIPRMEKEFVTRRTTNADGEREPVQAYHPNAPDEHVRPDDFIDRYVGKDYGTDLYHEVMSVGGESAFHGTIGGFGKVPDPTSKTPERKDDDHHAFVLGTYMTA